MTEMEKQRLKELLGESDEEEGDGDDDQEVPSASSVQEVHNGERACMPSSCF